MGREVNRPGKTDTDKKPAGKNTNPPSEAHGKKQGKRGWSDVFDNLTYSEGPGDNIYVFG